jgi:molybdate transport system substrate-binding protein
MKKGSRSMRARAAALCLAVLAAGLSCARREERRVDEASGEIVVAAAASLTHAFEEIGRRYTERTGVRVTYSFGATGDLAKQIENGAPFDLFAAADVEHVDALGSKNLLLEGTRAVFARGRLVLWVPGASRVGVGRVEDIAGTQVTRVAVARPEVAPYGRAAVEAMRALGIWELVEPKVVYAQNVAQARQFAATGNADAAFLPRALVREGEGQSLEIEEKLHAPIEHAIAVIRASQRHREAAEFVSFVRGDEGRAILTRHGYGTP